MVPQNISTITLFELATAGVPVAISSRRFFHELKPDFEGVLDELTFAAIRRQPLPHFRHSPVDW